MRTWMLLLLLGTGLCPAQEHPIKVDVPLVNVGFSVRDSQGALVNNLEKDDFEVLEDAVPQKVAFFARSRDVPLTLGLIVDDSGSKDRFSKQHQHDLEVFLTDVLGPQDRAFLVAGQQLFAFGRGDPGEAAALPAQQRALSGAGAEREARTGHWVLRCDLLLNHGKAGAGEREAGLAGVQRRRG